MKLTKETVDKAEHIFYLGMPKDIEKYLSNFAQIIAFKTLSLQGWYSCILHGKKVLFILNEQSCSDEL